MRLASKYRFNKTILVDERLCIFHIIPNAGKSGEIGINVFFGFGAGDTQLVSKAKCRYAINYSKVDRLRPTTDHRVHTFNRHAKHLAGCHRMDIKTITKGFGELGNICHMRQNT